VGATQVIDSHHHLWDLSRAEYPWMADDSLAPIRRTFTVDDLEVELEANGVDATVVVQARSDPAETAELLRIGGRIAGVVGWVDLTARDVANVIASLKSGPGGGRLVGIRHQVHDEPDPDWLLRDDVHDGLVAVRNAGLAYDLLVREAQLPAARAVAEEIDDLRFVIDHLAKPRIADRAIDDWARAMAPFATLPNVSCKVSGMVTEADWHRWSEGDLGPYVEGVLEWFGPARLMFGSDWPVCLLAAPYAEVIATARALLEGLSSTEQAAVFGGTAIDVYGIQVVA
jgi:L-fuconolactonase